MEIYAKRFLREVSYAIVVMGIMEDIREIIRHTDLQDRDAIEATKIRIRQIITQKADYMRDLARMCVEAGNAMFSALQMGDIKTAGRICEIIMREANNIITKGTDLMRDIEEAKLFEEVF